MWHETGARNDGTIAEYPNLATRVPEREPILNGPHIHLGNPFYKTPKNPCSNNLAWDAIDLTAISMDYLPRVKFKKLCDETTYVERQQSSLTRTQRLMNTGDWPTERWCLQMVSER